MHTFRLLNMAEEIALYQQVIVQREERDFLLKIRNGEFEFDDLMTMVEGKMEQIKVAYEKSTLPDSPDIHILKACWFRYGKIFMSESISYYIKFSLQINM
jgi:hypothetical protein